MHFMYISAESFEKKQTCTLVNPASVTAFAPNASKGLNVTFPWEVSLVYFQYAAYPDQDGFRKITVLCSKLTLLPSYNTEHILTKDEGKRKSLNSLFSSRAERM